MSLTKCGFGESKCFFAINYFRYNEMLIITDTCQAESMGAEVYSPNVLTIGSSRVGEDSLAVSL